MNDIHSNDQPDRPPAPPQPSLPPQADQPQAQPWQQSQQGFPHPQTPAPPQGAPVPPPVQSPPSGEVHDDVWGVRPPVLGRPTDTPAPQGYGPQGYGPQGYEQQDYGQQTGYPGTHQPGATAPTVGSSSHLDRGLSALQRSPLRRDTSAGIIGGVAAGIAKRMNVSPAAVRIATVALALFFGSGIAAYLIAWALLPDEAGRTHVEQGVKGGNAQSLIVTALAGLAALGMISTLLDGLGWLVPVAVTAGIVYYVVNAGKKKGDGSTS